MYSFCFENKFNITTSTRQDNNLSGNLSGNKDFDNFNKIIYFLGFNKFEA